MRNLLALSAAVLLTVAVVGWYRGWYMIGTTPGEQGHRKVTVDINTPKVKEDTNKFKEEVREIVDEVKHKNQNPTTQGTEPATHSFTPQVRVPATSNVSDEGSFVLPGANGVSLPPPNSGPTSSPEPFPPLPGFGGTDAPVSVTR